MNKIILILFIFISYQNNLFSEDCFGVEKFMPEWFVDDNGNTIDENIDEIYINIYPNPTENELSIESKNEVIDKIEIFDNLGKLCFAKNSIKSNIFTILNNEINSFSGKYSLKIYSGNSIFFKSIIIEK